MTPPAPLPTRLSPEVEEAHAKLVKALHGTILQAANNAPPKQQSAVDSLTTLIGNILREPGNEKFRRVRCTNETLKARLLGVKGGEDFLRTCGFREQTIDFTRFLVLPSYNEECDHRARTRALAWPPLNTWTGYCRLRSACCSSASRL
jgi:hypothetical protein